MDVLVKFGGSRSNPSRDIRLCDGRTDELTMPADGTGVTVKEVGVDPSRNIW